MKTNTILGMFISLFLQNTLMAAELGGGRDYSSDEDPELGFPRSREISNLASRVNNINDPMPEINLESLNQADNENAPLIDQQDPQQIADQEASPEEISSYPPSRSGSPAPLHRVQTRRRFAQAVMDVVKTNAFMMVACLPKPPASPKQERSSVELEELRARGEILEQVENSEPRENSEYSEKFSRSYSNKTETSTALDDLIQEQDNPYTHDLIEIENSLSGILKSYPQLKPTINRCAVLLQMGDDHFDIERYTNPRSYMNIISIISGICLDAGQILATYIASKWIGVGVIGFSIIDALTTGINNYLDTKIQHSIDEFDNDPQENHGIIVGTETTDMLKDISETLVNSFSSLKTFLADHEELYAIKESSSYVNLDYAIKHLKKAFHSQNPIIYTTRGLAVLGGFVVGMMDLILSKESTIIERAATVSMGLSSLAERISKNSSFADTARYLVLSANTYICFWDVIDLVYDKLLGTEKEVENLSGSSMELFSTD